jgi:hypothetical protein
MKQTALLWIIPVVFFMISCPQATVQNPYQDLAIGTFWAQDWANKDGKYYKVDSVLLAEGEKCFVWAERSAGVSVVTGEALAWEFDQRIYDKIVGVFGSDELMMKHDIAGGKLTLFLLDIKDGFTGSGAYVAGYFSSADLFSSKTFSYSNERAMIYVDTEPSRLLSKESCATIAHELQHFTNYSARFSAGKRLMSVWIDEGLSAAAEQIYLGQHSNDRIAHFSSSETIKAGNNFFIWGERPDSILDEYATVYLFFQWLRLHGGIEIFKKIIDSEHHDYQAVVQAISETFAGDLESASWDGILRSWLAANYLNSPDGVYGYRDEIPNLRVWALGGSTRRLLPGEGVYSAIGDIPGNFPGNSGGPNIKYAGLSRGVGDSPESLVSLETLYPNGRLLTFNSNESGDPQASETGLLADGREEIIRRLPSAGAGRSATGDSWIIDARDILGRPGDESRQNLNNSH